MQKPELHSSDLKTGYQIIRLKEVCHLIGFTAKHIRHLERTRQFPRRVQLGPNSVGWRLMDLDEWIDSRIAPSMPPKLPE